MRSEEYLCQHDDEEFVCHICGNNKTTNDTAVCAELALIKTELKKLDQLTALTDTMNFMSSKFDKIMKGVAENKRKLENVQKENKALKMEVNMLKESVKYLNDQRVKNDCLITGIKVNDGESAVGAVLKLTKEAGVIMTEENISDAYFIKTKSVTNDRKSVVVKFNSKKLKDKLMSIKPKLNENNDTKRVFVHDYLSRETMSLLNYAKSLRAVGYRSVYAADGRVFTKMSELSKPRQLKTIEEVDDLLMRATIHNQKNPPKQIIPVHSDDSDN